MEEDNDKWWTMLPELMADLIKGGPGSPTGSIGSFAGEPSLMFAFDAGASSPRMGINYRFQSNVDDKRF